MRVIVRKTAVLLTLLTAVGLLGCSKTTAKKRTKESTGPAAMGPDQSRPSAKIEVPSHDCKSTPACLEAGYCTEEKGQCVVGDTDDCKQSKRCKHKGECVFHKGECVTTGKQ